MKLATVHPSPDAIARCHDAEQSDADLGGTVWRRLYYARSELRRILAPALEGGGP